MFRCLKCTNTDIRVTGRWRIDHVHYECLNCKHFGWTKHQSVHNLLQKLLIKLTKVYILGYCKKCGSHTIYHETKCCTECGALVEVRNG